MDGETANKILKQGLPLVNERVSGALMLRDLAERDTIESPITIRNCVLDGLDAMFIQFNGSVVLDGVEMIGACNLLSCFFLAGFKAVRCRFRGGFGLQSGGHNKNGALFCLEDCQFDQFADFDDDWFEGPVTIKGCAFRGGANLFGLQGKPTQVKFDVEPVVEFNSGRLDLDWNAIE